MTWPTVPVDTSDTDADTDNPLQARQDLKDLMDKVNQIMAHVSTFAQTVLDDADAAAVRTTIGAAAAFPSGTRMLFQQTSAPTGWTKEVSATYNDAALRMTTGTVGTGGADAFSTTFGTSKSTAGFTLTGAESAAHTHGIYNGNASPGVAGGGNAGYLNVAFGAGGDSTGSSGGGGSHAHTLNNFNIKFADCIIAAKD